MASNGSSAASLRQALDVRVLFLHDYIRMFAMQGEHRIRSFHRAARAVLLLLKELHDSLFPIKYRSSFYSELISLPRTLTLLAVDMSSSVMCELDPSDRPREICSSAQGYPSIRGSRRVQMWEPWMKNMDARAPFEAGQPLRHKSHSLLELPLGE